MHLTVGFLSPKCIALINDSEPRLHRRVRVAERQGAATLRFSKPPLATTSLATLGPFREMAIRDLFEDNAQVL
jgi:hypothetical protein